jgi:hypothetical protein
MQVLPKSRPDANIMWNFTPVTFGGVGSAGTESLVTGISDGNTTKGQRIVGVSGKPSTGVFNGYTAWCLSSGSTYGCSDVNERDYPGAKSTYFAGQNQGKYEVGWAIPPTNLGFPVCNPCGFTRILNHPDDEGARRNTGSGSMSCFDPQTDSESSWCMFKEPKQGTKSCAVTEILGANSYEALVGYYETGSGSSSESCSQQAFGMNVINSGSGAYSYYKFSPPGATSSIAAGEDDMGAVVGTMTTSSGQIEAWTYVGSGYYPFQCGGGANETHGLGIVGIKTNLVVGYYVDSKDITHGFYVKNPTTMYPNCETIDYSDNGSGDVTLTAVTSINDKDDISGYFQVKGSPIAGFVGYCKANC